MTVIVDKILPITIILHVVYVYSHMHACACFLIAAMLYIVVYFII